MSALGLLTGLLQAYIFSILATVYVAAATSSNRKDIDQDYDLAEPDDSGMEKREAG
jgi:F-type H+-transporting ATPase subunit a